MNRYVINFEAESTKSVKASVLRDAFIDNDPAKQQLFNSIQNNLGTAITQAFAGEGETVAFVSGQVTDITFNFAGVYGGQQYQKIGWKASVTIDTEANFFNSPIAPIVIAAILVAIKIVAGAAILGISALAVIELIKSWTTKSWEVTYYDAEGNPVKTESGVAPDLGGLSIFLIAIVVIVAIGFFMYFGGTVTRKGVIAGGR